MKKLVSFFGVFLLLLATASVFYSVKNAQNSPGNPKTASNNAPAAQEKKIEPPSPTLESIFAQNENNLSELDQTKIIRLVATGDVIPARGANWPAVTSGNFNYNWEKTADYLRTGDITLINLEAPLLKKCPLKTEGFQFCGDSRHIQGIVFAGVDVANLANNHTGNYGQAGITETINLLETNGIKWSGFSQLGIREVKGTKFGFLGYNGIGVKINRETMAKEISQSKSKVDVLIVSVHWGKEYVLVPDDDGNIAPDKPIEIGHLIIDSGADLVIGNHPHWVQGVEFYKGKLVTYAHGNFIFDQTWSQETQEGVVGEYTFYEGKLINVRYKPIVVDGSYQPYWVEGDRAAKILKQMETSSLEIQKIIAKET